MTHDITPASVRAAETATRRPRPLGVALALALAIATFFSGMKIGELGVFSENGQASIFTIFASEPAPTVHNADLAEFWRVWQILDEKFTTTGTSTVTTEQKLQGAIDGLVVAYGDPYTVFLPPADTQALEADISGNFSGVGMEVGIRDDVITIIAPLPETPAEKAGVVAGDIIVSIDGQSTERMRVDEAVRLIRGEKGTTVNLTLFRKGDTELRQISIVRDNIAVPTVATERVDDTFIIKLYSFNAVSEAKVQEALREYVRSNATSLILDLRGNPGGLLQSAVAISGFFLPTGKVVVREDYGDDSRSKTYRSQGRTALDFSRNDTVVLIDNGSASASEILAGALREHNAATLIGAPTFGKGSVQELVELPSGASVKVTVARWLTPNGVSISEGGLTPDILVSRTPQQFLNDEDPQKDVALRFLKGEPVESENATSTPAQ